MKPEEDAFRQAFLSFYKDREGFEIIERDDGYFDAGCIQRYFSSYDEWNPLEKKAMEFVKGRVLDVGCGAGRHSLYLQEKGLDVLGVDVSPLAIQICRLRGLKRALVVSIEDMSFKQDSFDSIIMMGNNFGLFGCLKKARRLLKRFHRIASKEALIIASTTDPYKTSNPAHLAYHKFNRDRGRMGGQVKIRVRFRKYATKWFDYLFVSKEEMEGILKGTGWRVKQYIESEGTNYILVIGKTAREF